MSGQPLPSGPNWSLLPHNPIAFFELPKNFERKMLKRKYNQYIRQFKPEKFPAEFQRIRAAYELLDGQLRYGTTAAQDHNPQFQWDAKGATQRPSGRQSSAKQSSKAGQELAPAEEVLTVPIYQRIETEPLTSIYDEYRKSSGKSPYEYYVMALISDVVTDDPLMFFKLILTGLQKHPNEKGLMSLLYEYLQQDFKSNQIPGILKTVSKVVTNQHFYFLTEKLWDEYLRQVDFKTWATTLHACEANLKEFRIAGQIAFYLHILPAAIFKGSSQWLVSKFELLRKAGTEIPRELETDFELAHQLFEYRNSIAKEDTYSQEIHLAIVHYFLLRGRKGDEAVITLQTSYALNPSLLLDYYGPDQPHSDLQLAIWDYVNEEVCQRHALRTTCLLYTSPSPRDRQKSRMPSSA